jgi:hypothetical protein
MAVRLAVAALIGAAVPLLGGSPAAAATVTCTSNTHVFDVRNNGDLWLYDHTAPTTGAFTWTNIHRIGTGFTGTVFSGAGGDIYRITADGVLRLYDFQNGAWTNASGTPIGTGFQSWFTNPGAITADSAGRIYVVDDIGNLVMYHYNKGTGTWDDGGGTLLDTGLGQHAEIAASGDGVIYATSLGGQHAGVLFRYRYDARSQRFTEYARQVGAGFNGPIFSPGGDVLYLRDLSSGTISWYHFNDDTGTWDNGGNGRLVGQGFDPTIHPQVTSETDTCAGPTPAPVPNVTPDPAPADAPIALTDEGRVGDGRIEMFYPDQAGHVIRAFTQQGLVTQQVGTIVTPGSISVADVRGVCVDSAGGACIAVLDSTGQVWLSHDSGSFTPIGGYLKEVRLLSAQGITLVGEDASGALWWRGQVAVGGSSKFFAWRQAGITVTSSSSLPDLSLFSSAQGPYGVVNAANGNAQFVEFGGLPGSSGGTSIQQLSVGTFEPVGVVAQTNNFPQVLAYDSSAGQLNVSTIGNGIGAWQPLPPLALAPHEPVSAIGTLPNQVETAVAVLGADGFVYVTSNFSGVGADYSPWQKVSTQQAATPPTLIAGFGQSQACLVFRGQDGLLYRYLAPVSTTQTPLSFTGGPLQ